VFARSTVIRRRTWDVPRTALAVLPADAAAITEGGRLARILGCHDCHGEHLEGRLFFTEPHVADLVAPNLSRLVPSYSDAELARAIRHGIRRDGTGLFAMPSASFFHLSDEDLGRLIAYLRRQPRRDGDERMTSIGPIGHVGVATGRLQTVAATMDHGATRMAQSPPTKAAARGEYLARIACSECHGLTFGGGVEWKFTDNLSVRGEYRFTDLDNFAAEIRALDLVLSIDNTTVHVAGAMGQRVWTMVPYSSTWRWPPGKTDSVWFPSMRVFQQPHPGDWGPVLREVKSALDVAARSIT
jgi:mono/diheme cytochrome c family protein